MKNKLLITTALVALTCSHNAYAENLPADATNLTSGSYVVERSDTQLSHSGDINLSGTASLDVKTQAIVEEEADEVDVSKTLNVSGNVSLADNASLSVINSDATDETEKPFMFVDGKYTQTGGELTLKQENGAGWRSTLNAKEADISSGTIKLDTGEIFIYGNADDGSQFNISGGTFEMNDSNISTYPAMSDGDNSQKGAAMTVSGGTFKMNESSLGRENSGDLDISGGEFTLENSSAIFHDGETGDINISGGKISLKDSSIIRGGDYQNEDGKPASGDINISGGKINVSGSSAEISSAGNINISNGAEINIASGSTLYAKVSAEDMSQAQKATLRVSDNDTRFNIGGTLNANIDGDDRGKIHFQNSNAKIDGNVEGASMIFEDSHTLSEAVTGTIGGLDIFEIQKGTLTYDKELAGGASSVWVDSGATLDIGTNALHSGGDKDYPGEGVHFKDNSTLKFTVTDKDTYGKIYANYVNISENGTTLDMNLNSAALKEGDEPLKITLFNPEDNETVDIEGKFANLTSNSRYDFADNGDGTYTVTANGTTASDVVAEAGGTASNAATAEAWDNVSAEDSSPVAAEVTKKFAELAGSTDSASQQAYVDALTAVAPEVAPMVQKTQTETANQVFSAVSTRLTGGSISTGSEGMSSGDSNPDAAVWVQGMYNHSELDDTSKAKGFDADSAGVALGIEKFINKNVKIGAGYAYTNTDIDGFMRDTDVDTHTAILYGEYKPSNWFINGIATYGWSDYSEDKNVNGVGVKADYDVETFGLQAMTGYDMQFKNFGLTPEVGLRYVHIKQDAYKDYADQSVSGNDSDILTGVIGAKFSMEAMINRCLTIKPEFHVAATYDMINDDVNSVVTLANGSAYAVDGEALDRFGMEFGAGITAEVNDNVEFSLGYEGKFREDYQDHTGLINAKYKF